MGSSSRLLTATSFLTRLPVGRRHSFGAEDVGRSTPLFPLVGAGLGALQLVPGAIAAALSLELPSYSTAFLGIVLLVFATGAFHLDALADFFDGFGGGKTREDVLRIMRDHAVGAYGGTALVLALIGRLVFLCALLDQGAGAVAVVAGALSRWISALIGWATPYARAGEPGLGVALTDYVRGRDIAGATTIALVVTALAAGVGGAWLVVVAGAVGALTRRACRRRIGGVTGDTLGATTEISELAVLCAGILSYSVDA